MVAAKICFVKFIRHLKIKPKQVKKEQGKRRRGKKSCLPSVQTPCKCKYPESLLWHWRWFYT